MFTLGTVTVVTAATGASPLLRCVQSVREQTESGIEHWVIVDGPEREPPVREVLADLQGTQRRPVLMTLPAATGKQRWCGHRIYGAASFLVNSQFVCFLDEDNWLEADHVASLLQALRSAKAQWAFSLRKLVNADGSFVALDNCESLGTLHHTCAGEDDFLVDTNCYLLPREVAAALSPAWYRPARPRGLLEADRMFTQLLRRNFPNAASNRKHTMNYRLGSRADSVLAEFFLKGNEEMRRAYPAGLPWEK